MTNVRRASFFILQTNCTFKEIHFISRRFRGLFLPKENFILNHSWNQRQGLTLIPCFSRSSDGLIGGCARQIETLPDWLPMVTWSILVILTGIVCHLFWILSCPPKEEVPKTDMVFSPRLGYVNWQPRSSKIGIKKTLCLPQTFQKFHLPSVNISYRTIP